MQAEIRENTAIKDSWSVIHPPSPEDSAAMTALRSAVAGMKGRLEGTAACGPFNSIVERVAAPGGVTFEADTNPALKKAGVGFNSVLAAESIKLNNSPARVRYRPNARNEFSAWPTTFV
jgi:hypothetical protein